MVGTAGRYTGRGHSCTPFIIVSGTLVGICKAGIACSVNINRIHLGIPEDELAPELVRSSAVGARHAGNIHAAIKGMTGRR